MEKYEKFEKQMKTFTGYMGQPEIKYFESGAIRTTFSIPLKENKDDEPTWLNCQVWGKLAEKFAEYPKSTLVTVQGYFKTEKNQDGTKEYLKFVVCLGD